ncbi:Syntaphilin [Bagarius yarrelli]|uniref:Syntaphilin n=1 Tax=Bagarius yarrelli TaxID=175774 RepID=A0A556U281_BAGYA|nr:Syntaphilin [Bagarius yarrelli]
MEDEPRAEETAKTAVLCKFLRLGRPAGTASSRQPHTHADSSISSTCSAPSCKGVETGSKSRSHPATPRRQAKYGGCSENHGIRPPAPEQYLTPLQQKEVCIRHLRARLKENVERLQDRDSKIGELRMQLTRMQEDWVEEECHRIEAQLALKEARKEIQQLQQAVEAVRSNIGQHDSDKQDCKSASGFRLRSHAGASRSCGCSPAHTIGRSATFSRLSSETLPGIDRNGNLTSEQRVHPIPANRGAATLPRGDGRPRLILEAALLSEQAPPPMLCSNLSRSSTYEKLCSGETVVPVGRPCRMVNNNCSCALHACLPHHHLFLHLPQQEAPPPPPPTPPAAPSCASEASDKPGFRSQACSPTITWISPEEEEEELKDEELSVITFATTAPDITLAEPQTISVSSSSLLSTQKSYLAEPPDNTMKSLSSKVASQAALTMPQCQQPSLRSPLSPDQPPQIKEENRASGATEEEEGQEEESLRCHWSRYFLVDLLAVVAPIAPTLAWLCQGGQRDVIPAYPMGSLLRGCCAVALRSLRHVGSTRSRGPSGTGGATEI